MAQSTVFKWPTTKDESSEEESDTKEEADIEANPNLDFNDILTGMGGAGFLSSGNESEEERK